MAQVEDRAPLQRFAQDKVLVTDFTFVPPPSSEADWAATSERPYLRTYDLGILGVSEGKVNARILSVSGNAGSDRRQLTQATPFHFTYVFQGQVTLDFTDDGRIVLDKGDSIIIPPGKVYSEDVCPDYRCLEVLVDAHDPGDPAQAPITDPAFSKPLVNREREDAYIQGLRSCFLYREVGAMEATNNRISAHIVRVAGVPEGGTGWHCHRGARVGIGIAGWADVIFEGGYAPMRIVRESGNAVPPLLVHNAHVFSEDYALIEFGFPGVVESIRRAAPAAQAS